MQKNFLKQLLSYLPSKLLPALTAFIVTPIVTRLFPPAEYGYWALAVGVADFLYALSCSGLGSGGIRFFATYKAKSQLDVFFTTLGVTAGTAILPVSFISVIVITFLKGYLSPELFPLMLLAVLSFAIQAIYNILRGVIVAEQKSMVYTALELATRYVGVGLGLLLVIAFGFGIDGLMWGEIGVFILTIPFIWAIATKGVKISLKNLQLPEVGLMWRYALPLAIGNMAMWGLRLSDRYVISFFRSETEVGLYSVAYNLSGKSVDILAALFGLSMFPMLMKVWETDGREATEKTLGMFTRIYLILGLPFSAGLAVLAMPFVSVFTSDAYFEGYRVVGFVAFSSLIWQLSQMASYGMLIKKRTKQIAINQIVAALVNLALNIVFVPRFGFFAAGVTTLVGYLTLLFMQVYTSRQDLTWQFPWTSFRNTLVATGLMSLTAVGTYSLSGDISGFHLGYLVISVLSAILVYFVSLWLLGEANEKEKGFVNRLGKRILMIAFPNHG